MKAKGVDFASARTPEGMRLYAIGDPHGRLDLLEGMHKRIADEIARDKPDDWRVIHLGDYVDRGPDSRGVLDFLITLKQRDERFVFLTGNHDQAMLHFLATAQVDGIFVRNGGVQTVRSYGVDAFFESPEAAVRTRNQLMDVLPQAHLRFLRNLDYSCSFGDFFFCHAGIRPGVALDKQSRDDLIWIRGTFLNNDDLFEKVVVHGHTPQTDPEILRNRVNVDTGACFTGRLTAFVAEGDVKQTFSVWEA
ncbi:metallophosphoesterase family protein [Oryzicola mucosus]|uniref:Serine/threonine protein phosphatase n=1 Tax=Oryzicola mucosus TaxID=2767425 RepID=A0A8J6TWX1_9HYPH|nr:metallophosphoesterase family protein [Oryzicola mucosus]MBD0413064.1 serine/threonine protein phosphatase [Oryzicola mucosus]